METEKLKTTLYDLSERGLELKILESISGGLGIFILGLVLGIFCILGILILNNIDSCKLNEYNANKLKNKKYVEDLNRKNEIHLSTYSDIPKEIINFRRDILLEIQCKIKQLFLLNICFVMFLLLSFSGMLGIFNKQIMTDFYKEEVTKIIGYDNLINKYEIKEIKEIKNSFENYFIISYIHDGKLITVDYRGTIHSNRYDKGIYYLDENEKNKNVIEIVNRELYNKLKKELKIENKELNSLLDSYLDYGLMNVYVNNDFLIENKY